MKTIIAAAGALALFAALGAADAVAQGRGNSAGHGNAGGFGRSDAAVIRGDTFVRDDAGLDRADIAAGEHGMKGRAEARTHGANAMGFCPPGQKKKAGLGSRFRC